VLSAAEAEQLRKDADALNAVAAALRAGQGGLAAVPPVWTAARRDVTCVFDGELKDVAAQLQRSAAVLTNALSAAVQMRNRLLDYVN
jgi:hypothetical protein